MIPSRRLRVTWSLALFACGPAPAQQSRAAEYLYLWTASAVSSWT